MSFCVALYFCLCDAVVSVAMYGRYCVDAAGGRSGVMEVRNRIGHFSLTDDRHY